jgi:hypothetical protein
MDPRTMLAMLIDAANRHCRDLHQLCIESQDDDTTETHKAYQHELNITEDAIESGRKWLAANTQDRPNRIIIDITRGLFNGAFSRMPIQVLLIDTDDPDNPRATVPGYFGAAVWAELAEATVDPDLVDKAFDGITWIENQDNLGNVGPSLPVSL